MAQRAARQKPAPAPGRTLELVALDDLRPHPENPKSHDLALLRSSLGTFGYVEPIVEDARTGYLVSGHGRRELLLDERDSGGAAPEGVEVDEAGVWQVPVVRGWSSHSDAEARAVLVALNQAGPRGGWHEGQLADVLQLVAADDLLELTGFGADELDRLLRRLAPPDAFAELDPDMETDYRCPSCGYEWSGAPAPPGAADA